MHLQIQLVGLQQINVSIDFSKFLRIKDNPFSLNVSYLKDTWIPAEIMSNIQKPTIK